jgi:hypothetical protein
MRHRRICAPLLRPGVGLAGFHGGMGDSFRVRENFYRVAGFIRPPEDRKRKWIDDEEARVIFSYAKGKAEGHTMLPCYAVIQSLTLPQRRSLLPDPRLSPTGEFAMRRVNTLSAARLNSDLADPFPISSKT